ncbi:MAG: lytic transglycosylase domain-containing protein [Desulfobacterales bacterium]
MQLMPRTARSLGVSDLSHPGQNIDAGTRYLKQMMDKYDGNISLPWLPTTPAREPSVGTRAFHPTGNPTVHQKVMAYYNGRKSEKTRDYL